MKNILSFFSTSAFSPAKRSQLLKEWRDMARIHDVAFATDDHLAREFDHWAQQVHVYLH